MATADIRTATAAAVRRVFVARQPILDRHGRVYGYELLYRQAANAAKNTAVSEERATAHVLTDGLLAIGLDTLTSGRKAFINVSRQFLLDGIPAVLAPGRVVFEIGADVEADTEVIDACKRLRESGYEIAIDNFLLTGATSELLPLANFVKIDFLYAPTTADRAVLLPPDMPASAALIATKVETADRFQQAMTEGYSYFQGYFFGRPAVKEGRTVPAHQVAQLRLLRALNDPNLSVHQIEALVKPDPSMCYRILRAVNSAQYALQTTVHSIHEALILLGRDTVKRWASLWSLASLGQATNGELLVTTVVRARHCELLAASSGRDDADSEGFLMGMCSLLDVILDRPMVDVLKELPLPESIAAALRGDDTWNRRVLDCAIAYEQGDWDRAIELAEATGVDPRILASAYSEALRWARTLDTMASEPVKG